MHRIQLNNVDLNLLVTLDTLLRTHNVNQTAVLMGRTQSAISHALNRLRAQLKDPLFVRTGRGLQPTAEALDMAEPLRALLVGVEQLLVGRGQRVFDPAKLERTFHVGTTDMAEALLLPSLVERLR